MGRVGPDGRLERGISLAGAALRQVLRRDVVVVTRQDGVFGEGATDLGRCEVGLEIDDDVAEPGVFQQGPVRALEQHVDVLVDEVDCGAPVVQHGGLHLLHLRRHVHRPRHGIGQHRERQAVAALPAPGFGSGGRMAGRVRKTPAVGPEDRRQQVLQALLGAQGLPGRDAHFFEQFRVEPEQLFARHGHQRGIVAEGSVAPGQLGQRRLPGRAGATGKAEHAKRNRERPTKHGTSTAVEL